MKRKNDRRESGDVGWAWFAVPLASIVSVVATLVIISQPHTTDAAVAGTSSLAVGSSTARANEVRTANDPSGLDLLRDDATLGDPRAGIALVSQLLDRFESTGRSDHLYEAVQWMDRGWANGHYQSSNLPSRVFERYCDHGALRWHWLCDHGE